MKGKVIMEVWLTTREAAELVGISRQAVLKNISAGKWISRQEKLVAGGGREGAGYLVALSSLPVLARQKYYRRYGAPVESEQRTAVEPSYVLRDIQVTAEVSKVFDSRFNLAEVKALVGEKKFNKLMDGAECKANAVTEALGIQQEDKQKTRLMEEVARKYGTDLTTLYRWIDKYQIGGTVALMRKLPRLGVGTVRRAIDDEETKYGRREYLQLTRPKAAQVYKKLKKWREKQGLPYCSRATFYRFIDDMEKYEPDLVCLAREGEEEYMKKFAIKATRKEPDYVNAVWEGDHHKIDAFIKYKGRPVRPWLTIWMDVCSRAIVGYTVSVQANGQTIALATRYGILPKERTGWDGPDSMAMVAALKGLGWEPEELREGAGESIPFVGLPETLYIDNGEDYKSKLKQGKKHEGWEYSREMRNVCELLNIKSLFCTKYSPWAKGHCERWFGTFTSQFTRYIPGYCGNNENNRPPDLDERALAETGMLLNLEEMCKLIEMYLWEYHNAEHSTLGMTPLEKYISTPKIRDEMPNSRAFDICLMDVERAKVTSSGIQRFGTAGGARWYKSDILDPLAGQWVVIRYDPNRIGEILVFSVKTGDYICTATNRELLAWGASKKDLDQFCRRRAARKREIKERLKEIRNDLPEMVEQRESAGPVMLTGTNIDGKTDVTMITGMEKAAKARQKGSHPEKPKNGPAAVRNRFDEYIRSVGRK